LGRGWFDFKADFLAHRSELQFHRETYGNLET
jgi:hypothetical protein